MGPRIINGRSMYCLSKIIYLLAIAPSQMPPELYDLYTFNDQIPVLYSYQDDSYLPSQPLIYTQKQIDSYIEQAVQKKSSYYGVTDQFLYQALEKYRSHIFQKQVAE